jgi:tRNA(Ile)-lysidine synthase
MIGSKKVKKLFMERQIPRDERSRVPLIFSGDNLIVVGGWQLAHQVRVTGETGEVLAVCLEPAAG